MKKLLIIYLIISFLMVFVYAIWEYRSDGTVVAVVWYHRSDILNMMKTLVKSKDIKDYETSMKWNPS